MEVMVGVLNTLERVVPVNVTIHPLDYLLPPAALVRVIIKDSAVDEELQGGESINPILVANRPITVRVNLCQRHRRVMKLELLGCKVPCRHHLLRVVAPRCIKEDSGHRVLLNE